MTANSMSDVFRFVQLRPARTAVDVETILLDQTELTGALEEAGRRGRRRMATQALSNPELTVSSLTQLFLGERLLTELAETLENDEATTGQLLDRLGDLGDMAGSDDFAHDRRRASDTLIAAFYADEAPSVDVGELGRLFRLYVLIEEHAQDGGRETDLRQYLRRPLLTPVATASQPVGDKPRPRERDLDHDDADTAATLDLALGELVRLDRLGFTVEPEPSGRPPRKGTVFAATDRGLAELSRTTRALLDERDIDVSATAIPVVVEKLESERRAAEMRAIEDYDLLSPSVPSIPLPAEVEELPAAQVRPAGVADLLVVKQQIKRYERGEIAHIENVLAGEKKSRSHRTFERSEETFTREVEVTSEQEKELETAERFELNRETSKTIKNDEQLKFGLSVSGKYGPTVEFSSNLEMSDSTITEESSKKAGSYSKDVVQRSLERISERVSEKRVQKLLREREETNLHELHNETANHSSGIYQFVDKIYEAQVFNYGIRQMFDFMVPEPASFLWWVRSSPQSTVSLPDPPRPLSDFVARADQISSSNFLSLAARYGATEIQPPPPLYQTVSGSVQHGGEGVSESGKPRSQAKIEISIPAGYIVRSARVEGLALTDEHPVIGITIGTRNLIWEPDGGDRIDLGSNHELAHQPTLLATFPLGGSEPTEDGKATVSVVAWETATYSLTITMSCLRTEARYQQWQIATYDKIRDAYQDRRREYEQKLAEAEAEAEAVAEEVLPFGAPPSQNRETILTELKKHCISMITGQRYDAFDATQDTDPPEFDFAEAEAEGSFIRFFEQAFEWDQMQWVFYPYFWARKADTWVDRFLKQDTDPEFRDFWRAGSARVVVPVRPGFEVAVTHYLETDKLWNGIGSPPDINSPLYIPIVDEIKERTGAPQGEEPVGDPWDVRVPTPLVLVRPDAELPHWVRLDPEAWEWAAADAPGLGGEDDG